MVKPVYILLFLCLVAAVCLGIMAVFPKDGIAVGPHFRLKFPTWETFWTTDSTGGKVSMDELYEIYSIKDDSAARAKALENERTARIFRSRELQVPPDADDFISGLNERFASLPEGNRLRILHFGDSQIEADRISELIRSRLQTRLGGSGPGWLPIVEVIPTPAVRHSQSSNWIKYNTYTSKASRAVSYGVLAACFRFTPPPETEPEGPASADSTGAADMQKHHKHPAHAWFEVYPSTLGHSSIRRYSRVRLAMGDLQSAVSYAVYADKVLVEEGIWEPVSGYMEWQHDFNKTPATLRFEFDATESPDFYGISLESATGFHLDNIPMRGSAGTIFTSLDADIVRRQAPSEEVGLILLQFGGNTIPYMKSEQQAVQYGKWFRTHIAALRRWYPAAQIVFIGPSDMSAKSGDEFRTIPFLESVRDALKEAAFSQGCAYWDLYEAMGGPNSMPQWVNADPPLASTDHVHFTPSGARQVAGWLYAALFPDTVTAAPKDAQGK